jgi:uncharacterized spore protein YtfJ
VFETGGTEMAEKLDEVIATTVKGQEQGNELMEKLMAVAQPGSVFSQPYTSGDYTVITAAEVSVGMGFGYGMGGGTAPEEEGQEAADLGEGASGFGGGGGGGGFSQGRPVAVISISSHGVMVEPVRDATKIALAFITALGAMLLMFGRMLKASRK